VDDLKVRIGLNTGLVVVGSIGSDLHMEYLAIGDTVNLAARMQTAAEPGSVLLTESTQRLVAPLFDLLDLGEVAVKGKAEPVHVYEVQGKRHGAMRLRGVAGLSSPMVAREREFATLMQVAAGVGSGQGGIVSIVGEAGLGKSRLLAEWEEALRRESAPGPGAKAPIRCVAAHCVSYGASVAYYLSSELLRGFIAAPPGASAEETREALWRTCQAQLGSDAEETALSLGHMLGLPMPDQDAAWLKYLDGPALQARYVAGYRRLLGAMVQQAPTLVVVDDLQWADPSSVQLGLELLPLAARLPLVLAFAARPDRESAGWKLVAAAREVPGAGALELHLAPLAEADSRQLLDNLLDKAPLPEPVCALILDRSEGNPFFVEEVLRMLMEHGVFARRDGRWTVVGGVEGLDIPDTLQGVIMARIDRLPEDTKHVLRVASVIGRSFQSRLLDMVLVGETP
jgi:predicted ATPase